MEILITLCAPTPETRTLPAGTADISSLQAFRDRLSHGVSRRIRPREDHQALACAAPEQGLARLLCEVPVPEADLLAIAARHGDALLPLWRMKLDAREIAPGIRPDNRAFVAFRRAPIAGELRVGCAVCRDLLD